MEYTMIDEKAERDVTLRNLALEAFREAVVAEIELSRIQRLSKLPGEQFANTRKLAREAIPEAKERLQAAQATRTLRAKAVHIDDAEYQKMRRGILTEWIRDLESQHVAIVTERKGSKGEERKNLSMQAEIIEVTHALAEKEFAKL